MSAEATTERYPVHLDEAQRLYPDASIRRALSRAVFKFVDDDVIDPAEAAAMYRQGENGIYDALAMLRDLTIGSDAETPTYSI